MRPQFTHWNRMEASPIESAGLWIVQTGQEKVFEVGQAMK
jgi:hypothetical protein